jgi:hypothetical protein
VLHDDSPNASQAAANTCQPQLNKHMMHIHNYDDGLASIIENFREFIISLFFFPQGEKLSILLAIYKMD